MQFVKERLGKWITAAIILVVGILCIVAGAIMAGKESDPTDAINAISVVLGVVLIIVGALSLVLAIVAGVLAKKGFASVAIPGAVLLALGISMVVAKYAYGLINLLLIVIPYLLLCIGAVVLADAIFTFVLAIKAKAVKSALVAFIVAVVIAAVAITLGALCIGDDPVIKYSAQLIVFGIMVCLVACLQVLLTFVKLPDTVVAVVTVEKKDEAKEEKEEK